MKRIVNIICICAVVFSTIGINIIFPVQQYLIKKEIKRKIKNSLTANELTLITVDSSNEKEVDWEDGKEFHYRGNMFDVVKKKENQNGSVSYFCINDTQEKELFVNIHTLVKDKSEKENTLIKNTIEVQWMIPSAEEKNNFIFPPLLIQNNFSFSFSYQFSLGKSVSQPPEFI